MLTGLAADAKYIGTQVAAAASAAKTVLAAEPTLIRKAITAALKGDLPTALQSIVEALTAPLGPPLMVVNAIRTVIEQHLAQLLGIVTAAVPTTAAGVHQSRVDPAEPKDATDQQPAAGTPGAPGNDNTGNGVTQPKVLPNRATDLRNGNKFVPRTNAPSAGGPVSDALKAVGDQVRAAVGQFGDTVRKFTGVGGPAADSGPRPGSNAADPNSGGGAASTGG